MARFYRLPSQVEAQQFKGNFKEVTLVELLCDINGVYFVVDDDVRYQVETEDWIVQENDYFEVVSNQDFMKHFTIRQDNFMQEVISALDGNIDTHEHTVIHRIASLRQNDRLKLRFINEIMQTVERYKNAD